MTSPISRQAPIGLQRAVLGIALAAFFLALFLLYAAMAKLVGLHSDQATVPLYAKAVLEGNWGLRGWVLTTVGFYNEIPLYMAAIKLFGFVPDVMRYVPAFIHTVNIFLLGALVWKYRTKDKIAIFLPMAALAILPSNNVWQLGLYGPMHHMTSTFGFIVLLLVDENLATKRVAGSLAVLALSLVASWSDLAFAFQFCIPVVAAMLWQFKDSQLELRRALVRTGLPLLAGVCGGYFLMLTMKNAGFGAPAGFGGFSFDSLDRFFAKLGQSCSDWVRFFGVDFWKKSLSLESLSMMATGIGVAWWLLAMWKAAERKAKAVDVAAGSIFIGTVIFTALSYRGDSIEDARFLVTAYLAAAFLVCRFWQEHMDSLRVRAVGFTLAAASIFLSFLFLSRNHLMLAGDAYGNRMKATVAFLDARSLSHGYADFWACHLLRIASSGELELSPIIVGNKQHLVFPFYWGADRDWITGFKGRFAVLGGELYGTPSKGALPRDLFESKVIEYWGPPKERHEIDGYLILIWDEEKSIADKDMPYDLRPNPANI